MATIGDRKPPPKNGKGKSNNCRCCGQAHPLYRCDAFKGKTPQERAFLISAKKLCPNCLKDQEHSADNCPSSLRCRVTGCGAFHHSLLHPPQFHVRMSDDIPALLCCFFRPSFSSLASAHTFFRLSQLASIVSPGLPAYLGALGICSW